MAQISERWRRKKQPDFRRRHDRAWVIANIKWNWQIYLMLAGIMAWYIIFCYLPMYGVLMAFEDFHPFKGVSGSPWVGLKHFRRLFTGYYFWDVIKNTLLLNIYSLLAGTPLPIFFALIVNSLREAGIKKAVQTVAYAPHFISTVVVVGLLQLFFSPSGVVNKSIQALGGVKVNFMSSPKLFRSVYVWSDVWQNMGWNAIIYIAALAGVDPELHEAAVLDGATRLQRMRHIDIPCIMPTISILLIMSVSGLLGSGFEKAYLLQNDLNVSTSEVIATYTYKMGMLKADYSFSTAVGIFNSVAAFVLLIFANTIARHLSENSLW